MKSHKPRSELCDLAELVRAAHLPDLATRILALDGRVTCPSSEELDELLTALGAGEGAAEDWTGSVRSLCAQCSLGEPHDHEETPEPSGWQVTRRIGVAARSEDALRPLRRMRLWWRKGVHSVKRVR